MNASEPSMEFVSVRDLVELVYRRGDLGGGGELMSLGRAREGARGHQRRQRSQKALHAAYESEVSLERDVDAGEFVLRVRGRADGLTRDERGLVVEEIKTTFGAPVSAPVDLHWAQAKIYGSMAAAREGLAEAIVQLAYVHLDTGAVRVFEEAFSARDLESYFDATVLEYLDWARAARNWRRRRDESIQSLRFPFPRYRPGQRDLSVAIYRAVARERALFAEAPTGIGKTISALFPAVKALGEGKADRVFYLTAKTAGRAVAEEALERLAAQGAALRRVTLVARDRVCLDAAGAPCDRSTCPRALGYYDRLKPALRAALSTGPMDRAALETAGRDHQVCPHAFAMDAGRWADVIVGDYNHALDPLASVKRFFADESVRSVFLIDEAHNLVDRARDMFSAELNADHLRQAERSLRAPAPKAAKDLKAIVRLLEREGGAAPTEASAIRDDSSLARATGLAPRAAAVEEPRAEAADLFPETLGNQADRAAVSEPREAAAKDVVGQVEPRLRSFLGEAEAWLMRNERSEARESLLELFYRAAWFLRVAERRDEGYSVIVEPRRIRLYCADPSGPLRESLERARTSVFFSATLSPIEYFQTALTGGVDHASVRLPSPFPEERLRVLAADRIRTDYQSREASLSTVAEWIREFIGERVGNYLVFFPSYGYLDEVWDRFEPKGPIRRLRQKARMSETERAEFLETFRGVGSETLVGFAVMGGVFGEAVDLVGDCLVGAVLVGVGLPQICVERELIREQFDRKCGRGFDFAYRCPGINRVLQSAGRVIRSEHDAGAVLLIDERFGRAAYRRMLPPWWRVTAVRSTTALRGELARFWIAVSPAAGHSKNAAA